MIDFPASPTNGQVSNGFSWSAADSAWLPVITAIIFDPPLSETAEYNRYLGGWWKRYERFPIVNVANQQVVMALPTTTKMVRWWHTLYYSGAAVTPNMMYMVNGVMLSGTASRLGKYHVSGSGYGTGTGNNGTQNPPRGFEQTNSATVTGVIEFSRGYVGTNGAPLISDGFLMTQRLGTTQRFRGHVDTQSYNSNATDIYAHAEWLIDIGADGAGATTITQLRLNTASTTPPGVGAYGSLEFTRA